MYVRMYACVRVCLHVSVRVCSLTLLPSLFLPSSYIQVVTVCANSPDLLQTCNQIKCDEDTLDGTCTPVIKADILI